MIVSGYQGASLSASDRRRLEQYRLYSRPQSNFLREQTEQTLAELDRRKEQGVKPERLWFLEFEAKGTPCVAELFGF
ncbi:MULTISPECIES: hypothetical protein [Pseudomonadales]|uniref:hypothetical protein n=1 Tax=Pseudomonadales TaxID=72274 RepID=UPI003A8FA1A6